MDEYREILQKHFKSEDEFTDMLTKRILESKEFTDDENDLSPRSPYKF
jgi:hypothetical protein